MADANSNGAQAIATVRALMRWLAGVGSVLFTATIIWNLTTNIDHERRLTVLETAMPIRTEKRYTSDDAARDKADLQRQIDSLRGPR